MGWKNGKQGKDYNMASRVALITTMVAGEGGGSTWVGMGYREGAIYGY